MSQIVQDPEKVTRDARLIAANARHLINTGTDLLTPSVRLTLVTIENLAIQIQKEMEA